MKIKMTHLFVAALGVLLLGSCEKEPSTSGLHDDYLVYTAYDTTADFSAIESFYLPDAILLIGQGDEAKYWTDDEAQQIISAAAGRLEALGYTRTDDKTTADVGLQLSYVETESYFVGYDNPYWWWYYPYYWSPGFWGDWGGWHYPYYVSYGYTAGSLLMEMVNLQADNTDGNRKLTILWNAYIGGLLTPDKELDQTRTLMAVNRAFDQSTYLQK